MSPYRRSLPLECFREPYAAKTVVQGISFLLDPLAEFFNLAAELVDGANAFLSFLQLGVQDVAFNLPLGPAGLLSPGRDIVNSTANPNWENVNKRIIPQLIYKGQVLQREEGCKKGLFFVCPTPVYHNITARLGGNVQLWPARGG